MPIVEELCTKYISYEIMTSKMWLIFGAILFVICWIVFGLGIWAESNGFGFDSDSMMIILCGIAVSIFPIIMVITQIIDIIKCTTFPELQILQYIQSFMN